MKRIITKLSAFFLLLTLPSCGANSIVNSKESNASSLAPSSSSELQSSSSEATSSNSFLSNSREEIDPIFKATFSHCQTRYTGPTDIRVFNLKSRYFLNILVENYFDGARVLLNSLSFEYDETFLIIENFISEDSLVDGYIPSNSFRFYVKPIKEIESTIIKLKYQTSTFCTFNISVNDLSIESDCLASKEYETSFEFERITLFETFEEFKEYRSIHKELTIKNEPNINSFENYEYVLLTLQRNEFGNNPSFNCSFIYDDSLYFDVLSQRDKSGQSDPIMARQKVILQFFIKVSKGFENKHMDIWNSVFYSW